MSEADASDGDRLRRVVRGALAVATLPAVALVGLLVVTMLARAGYPYDLEWMEGGLLGHAQRIASHEGIYVAPSIDFIPYLYTPLYPALLALLGSLFGVTYALGRAISILAVVATLAVMVLAVARAATGDRTTRAAARAGAALAAGLYAATYPWVEGWFDLVRGDSLFIALSIGGLHALGTWARVPGAAGRRRVAVAAGILALAYFCKQTGVLFCGAGFVLVLVTAWRHAWIYAVVAGAIGLGGTWLFQRATGGWFWIYVHDVLQAHDQNADRFWSAFRLVLGHFPAMTAAIAVGLIATGAALARTRRIPDAARPLLVWTAVFAVACLNGALAWAHQWAHFNSFMAAMATGAIAAGAALPATAAALAALRPAPLGPRVAAIAAAALALGLAVDVGRSAWSPARFVPTDADEAAGDALIARLAAAPGDVFVPFHPWYAVLAGKPPHVHRMGLLDVGYRQRLSVAGLREALAAHRFALVVLDDRPVGPELGDLRSTYRMDDLLPPDERPRTYSGARTTPTSLWAPDVPAAPPAGATIVFDFERDATGWGFDGTAWGTRPARGPLAGQGRVYRHGGRGYLSSFHGGDRATGTATSPEFTIDGARLTFLASGGRDPARLRVELVVDGAVERAATGVGSERMEQVMWDVTPHAGKRARIRLVDADEGSWGHLNVDEVWLWK